MRVPTLKFFGQALTQNFTDIGEFVDALESAETSQAIGRTTSGIGSCGLASGLFVCLAAIKSDEAICLGLYEVV